MFKTSDDYQPYWEYEDDGGLELGGGEWEYAARGPDMDYDRDDAAESENGLEKSTPSLTPVKVRQVFPETWLWTDETTGYTN